MTMISPMSRSNAFQRLITSLRASTLGRSVKVLSRNDQRKVVVITGVQVFLSLLDLLGVAAVGMLGALAVRGIQSAPPGDRVQNILEILHISSFSFQSQAIILAVSATFFLVFRTVLSVFFTRKILFFLSRKAARVSSDLISRLLAQPLLAVQSRSSQQTLYSLTIGVTTVTMGVLGTAVQMITDVALLVILFAGLIVVDPYIAILAGVIFGAIGLCMYFLMNVRAKKLGKLNSQLSIESSEKILEVLNSYRELTVRNRRGFYADQIMRLRLRLADTSAETQFLPNISKYVIESSIIIAGLIIGAQQFFTQDATHAVSTLGVFLAASTRIAPAIMRIQQSAIQIKGSLGVATPTLDLIDSLGVERIDQDIEPTPKFSYPGFDSNLRIDNLQFTYPNGTEPALNNIKLEVPAGTSLAIVGPSGAGKTTFVDAILGVLNPDSGFVEISGIAPLEASRKWSGAIAYVPQDVIIVDGTILENVALGYAINQATREFVWEALEQAQLLTFVETLPQGLDTEVGEKGSSMSGGQRQRLGIARAMFTKPKLLVLDEATSSLDGVTESELSASIRKLQGKVTVVMIAHRLSTVRDADLVVYMDKGAVIASGSFQHVRSCVPEFEQQAQLMGL